MTTVSEQNPIPGEIIEDLKTGVKVRFATEHLSIAQAVRIKKGKYEGKEVHAITSCLSGGERVLELGGGIGFVSSVVCKTKSPSSYDVVEANPRLIPMIKDTHALNEIAAVRIHNCIATSDVKALRRGYFDFNIGESFGASSIMKIEKSVEKIRVPTIDIGRMINQAKPNVLISDIEGAEVGLLDDVDISNIDLAIFEVHPGIVGLGGVDRLFRTMSRQGFAYSAKGSQGAVVVFNRHRSALVLRQGLLKKIRSKFR